jgi:hypothetical protein
MVQLAPVGVCVVGGESPAMPVFILGKWFQLFSVDHVMNSHTVRDFDTIGTFTYLFQYFDQSISLTADNGQTGCMAL